MVDRLGAAVISAVGVSSQKDCIVMVWCLLVLRPVLCGVVFSPEAHGGRVLATFFSPFASGARPYDQVDLSIFAFWLRCAGNPYLGFAPSFTCQGIVGHVCPPANNIEMLCLGVVAHASSF